MKNLNLILASILALSTFSTEAFSAAKGNEGSGGGNARVCFQDPSIATRLRESKKQGDGWVRDSEITNQTVKSVELLDYYEAKAAVGFPGEEVHPELIEAEVGETQGQYFSRIKDRFKDLSPLTVYKISKSQKDLAVVKKFEHGLNPIDDVGRGENIETDNCVRMTIIGQYTNGGSSYIGYDSRVFALSENIFSVTNRSLSFLHEYIYFRARANKKEETSDSTRKFVGMMITKNLNFLNFMNAYNAILAPEGFFLTDSTVIDGSSFFATIAEQLNIEFIKSNLNFQSEPLRKGTFESSEKFQKKCAAAFMESDNAIKNWYETVGSQIVMANPTAPKDILAKYNEILKTKIYVERRKKMETTLFCGYLDRGPYGGVESEVSYLKGSELTQLYNFNLTE